MHHDYKVDTLMSKPAVKLFAKGDDKYLIIVRNALVKQDGVCYSCRKPITLGQSVATKFTLSTRYYHEECAYRINLLSRRRKIKKHSLTM